jgi:glycosyltransferase involved in cell wall biosynthesis
MNLFMIKLGKAWNTVKREGIFRGGKRVLIFFGEYLQSIINVTPGDILFITAGVGDSALYRAHNQAEELRHHGFRVSVTMQDNPFLSGLADKFQIFIFHRTLQTAAVARLVAKIKAQHKEIIFDADDLVFDTKYVQQTDHYRNMTALEKKQYAKGVGEEILKDPYVKVCTTSTQFIAAILKSYGKKVFVTTNKLSEGWLAIADKLLANYKPPASTHEDSSTRGGQTTNLPAGRHGRKQIRIGYFSGTVGHNKDFATVSDALVAILEKYPQTELFLAGPLELEDKFVKYSGRIIRSIYVPRKKHFANIAACDIILAPLEKDPFSEGKSELKFSEAGLLEVPVVAVKNQTFSGAIIDGLNGFLADGTLEWTAKLERLVTDANLRRLMGERAREKALKDYTTKNSHSEEYYAYLRSRLQPVK